MSRSPPAALGQPQPHKRRSIPPGSDQVPVERRPQLCWFPEKWLDRFTVSSRVSRSEPLGGSRHPARGGLGERGHGPNQQVLTKLASANFSLARCACFPSLLPGTTRTPQPRGHRSRATCRPSTVPAHPDNSSRASLNTHERNASLLDERPGCLRYCPPPRSAAG
jgi:hypothetical protein